jgi:hypothetical protein
MVTMWLPMCPVNSYQHGEDVVIKVLFKYYCLGDDIVKVVLSEKLPPCDHVVTKVLSQ